MASGSNTRRPIWSFCSMPGWARLCPDRTGDKFSLQSQFSFEQFEGSLVSMCKDVLRLRGRIGGDWVVTFGLPTRCLSSPTTLPPILYSCVCVCCANMKLTSLHKYTKNIQQESKRDCCQLAGSEHCRVGGGPRFFFLLKYEL